MERVQTPERSAVAAAWQEANMSNDTRSSDLATGAPTMSVPSSKPGLIRSIAHRLAGEQVGLPVEGHLASLQRRDRVAQLGAAHS